MSVIGATGWYIEAFQNGTLREVERDLILGLYPISFLKETAQMLVARFYTSIVIQNDINVDISQNLDIRGSLLPFSTHNQEDGKIGEEIFLERSHVTESDHSSVKLCSIEADGSVRIPEAAVLAPASDHEAMPLIANVTLAYPMGRGVYRQSRTECIEWDEGNRTRSIDLRKWEKNWWPFSKNYAVSPSSCRHERRDHIRGILLKETRSGAFGKVGIFTKIGLYEEGAMTHTFPIQSTDWNVL